MTTKELEQLIQLIEDLGFDYDRMSSSGQSTYDKIELLTRNI